MSKYEPASKLCVRAVFVRAYPIWKKSGMAYPTSFGTGKGKTEERKTKGRGTKKEEVRQANYREDEGKTKR